MYERETLLKPQTKLVVPIVVGTRPEAIKLVPIITALRQSESYEPIVVSTGQHNKLVQYIFELAGIKPDVTLWAGSMRAHLNARVASVMQRFDDFCVEQFEIDPDAPPTPADVLAGRHPAAVLVHGDTSSAMAASLSAFHLRIPVMHVEAGLRTGGNNLMPFPEELNRQVISTIAAMHFAPTSANMENLVRENIPVGQIFVTGNTGIDALHWASKIDVKFANPELQALHDSDKRIVVVTAHRRENWGDGLRGIAEGVARVAVAHPDVHCVLPVHPNPRVREVLTERLSGLDHLLLAEPLGYAPFARLLGRAHLMFTDSGGIQEEAPSLGKPVLVTRETTERTEGLEAGTLRLVGTDPRLIAAEASRLLGDDAAYAEMAAAPNPYGDGHAAERIVAALEHIVLGGEPPTQFGPGYNRRPSPSPPVSRTATARCSTSSSRRSAARRRRGCRCRRGRARAGAGAGRGDQPPGRGLAMDTPRWPFEGLALPWEILFTVCLVVAAMFLWSLLLFVRAHAAVAEPPPVPPDGADAFSWVFLVPALNEEVTIADSVQRLLSVPVERRRVVVIDDGSDDRTPEILAAIDDPDLFVLRRDQPNARQGKAAALNYAYRSLRDHHDRDDRDGTIFVIVDADGRLHGSAPAFAASHFAEPRGGGMQSLVRIYNRGNLLTWLQDVEFSVYGHLFQAGRDHWGTAGMGGNGQFNRLSALDDLADAEGPWRDRLTEDQDLGLRLLAAGWEGRQDLRATVDQQGLSRLRPLFGQRTRWSQGNLQAIGLRREVARAPVGRGARLEQMAYLLMPFWQGIIGLGLLGALALAIAGRAPFWGAGPTWQLGFFYLLAFGGTVLGCIAARSGQGPLGWLKGFLVAQVYTPYTWFLWPVLLRSTARQISSREGWAKTEREPLSGAVAAGRP